MASLELNPNITALISHALSIQYSVYPNEKTQAGYTVFLVFDSGNPVPVQGIPPFPDVPTQLLDGIWHFGPSFKDAAQLCQQLNLKLPKA